MTSWKWKLFELPFSPRYNHATMLADDKIYLYGGEVHLGRLHYSDELIQFDIISEKATLIGERHPPMGKRGSMSAVWAEWRREIVYFGGIQSGIRTVRFNDTHSFNVDSRTWKELLMKGKLPIPRTGNACVLVGRCMYVYGGHTSYSEYLGDIQIADLSNLHNTSWSTPRLHGNASVGRTVSAFNYLKGFFICYGGYSPSAQVRHRLELFDPRLRRWLSTDAGEVRCEGSAPANTNYHIGVQGTDAVIYFTKTGVFELRLEA